MKEEQTKILAKDLEDCLGIPNIIARILVNRGFLTPHEAEVFLFPKIEDLSDPFLLPDCEKGIRVLIDTMKNKRHICLYGDYDADGITSCALMVNFLNKLNVKASIYIPERKEGYGLNMEAIKKLKKDKVDLIICLDCGSANMEEIKFGLEMGIKTIIIDHHEVPDALPPAEAVINPKRRDSLFPTRDLAACGVTFFFLWALRRVIHKEGLSDGNINLKNELDLVTIGTLGDMVPLIKDNRILTKMGMEIMKKRPKQWLKAFYKENLLPRSELNEFSLNFIVIPRINAAGRVSMPEESLDFLVTEKESESIRLLKTLQEANNLRQRIGEKILKECKEEIMAQGLDKKNTIVLFNRDWHIGVIGIVAQKLAELYKKPSLVITEVDGICKGSARGIEEIDLFEIMSSLSHIFIRFCGHRLACGFSLKKEDIPLLKERFEYTTGNIILKRQEVYFDTHADFDELDGDFASHLEVMSPFGIGNPRPFLMITPHEVTLMNSNRVKITDKSFRQWYGYINNTVNLPEKIKEGQNLIVQPIIKEEMGNKFINLNVKAVL
ncbi:MAG TPA: single-stranded-DNA-specific exonuclease RecJ [Syntrophorhabdaceae bacterium]|nr:single-stranded-DNA-specific exonuclease RecJ [Syntrophorhabdaceae bacterium]